MTATRTDELMDIAQELLVHGSPEQAAAQQLARLTGESTATCQRVVSATASHPVTKAIINARQA